MVCLAVLHWDIMGHIGINPTYCRSSLAIGTLLQENTNLKYLAFCSLNCSMETKDVNTIGGNFFMIFCFVKNSMREMTAFFLHHVESIPKIIIQRIKNIGDKVCSSIGGSISKGDTSFEGIELCRNHVVSLDEIQYIGSSLISQFLPLRTFMFEDSNDKAMQKIVQKLATKSDLIPSSLGLYLHGESLSGAIRVLDNALASQISSIEKLTVESSQHGI